MSQGDRQEHIAPTKKAAGGSSSVWVSQGEISPSAIAALAASNEAAILTVCKQAHASRSKGEYIVGCNEAWCNLCGYPPEEAIGKSPKLLQGEDTDMQLASSFSQAMETSKEASCALINYSKAGRRFLHHLHSKQVGRTEPGMYVLTESHGEGPNFVSPGILMVMLSVLVVGLATCSSLLGVTPRLGAWAWECPAAWLDVPSLSEAEFFRAVRMCRL